MIEEKKEGLFVSLLAVFTYVNIFSYSFSFVLDILFSTNFYLLSYVTAGSGFLIVLLMMYEIIQSGFRISRAKLEALILAFIVIFMILFMYLSNVTLSNTIKGVYNSCLVRAMPCLIAGVMCYENDAIRSLEKFLYPLVFIESLVLFYVVISNPTGDISLYMKLGIDRQTLSYSGSYMFSMLLYYLVNRKQMNCSDIFKSSVATILSIVLLVSNIFVVFAGGGRGAIIVCGCVGLFFWGKANVRLSYKIGIAFLIIIICVSGYSTLSSSAIVGEGFLRITSFFSGNQDASSLERIEIYKSAWELIIAHPLIGNGVGGTILKLDIWAHNFLIDLMVDYGIIGFAVILVLAYNFIKYIPKMVGDSRINELAFVMGISYLIGLMFSGSYLSDGGSWFLLGFVMAYKESLYMKGEVDFEIYE